jgi:hypothetical protein
LTAPAGSFYPSAHERDCRAEHCAEGLDGYFARLAQRGLSITSPAPGRFKLQDCGANGQQRFLRTSTGFARRFSFRFG